MESKHVNILLVDDDEVFSKVFANELGRMGFNVTKGYGTDVLLSIKEIQPDVVILDIVMPQISGLELLKQIKKNRPSQDVIMLTGNATIENAITSMKEGAYDYFTKPVELDRVEQVLKRCLEQRKLRSKNQLLKRQLSDLREGQMIGVSPAITEIKSLIARFADSDSTVLIYGESGTGKELIANLIHIHSNRSEEPFIIVDCTALKESLLESELFGHERGAFTGAVTKKHGILEVADGGTVFLDEIGEISHQLQSKLLRVAETRSFRRLGGNQRIEVDIRLIAATNRDLLVMVHNGEFREDLYYRLNVINITMPPLKEHKEDIPLLIERFMADLGKAGVKRFTDEAIDTLIRYNWPGNIRELKNIVERAVLLSEGDAIEVSDLPLRPSPLQTILKEYPGNEHPSLHEIEDSYIKWVLDKVSGNKILAAKILKIDRKTISRRLGHNSDE